MIRKLPSLMNYPVSRLTIAMGIGIVVSNILMDVMQETSVVGEGTGRGMEPYLPMALLGLLVLTRFPIG